MGLPILAVAASLAPPPKRFGAQEAAKRDADVPDHIRAASLRGRRLQP